MMMGYATGSWAMARIVLASDQCEDKDFAELQVAVASFYFDKISPHARAHFLAIENGNSDYYDIDQAML